MTAGPAAASAGAGPAAGTAPADSILTPSATTVVHTAPITAASPRPRLIQLVWTKVKTF